MPSEVLTSDTASAPPSAAALAIGTTSVTFGVSLAMSGSGQASRHAADDPPRHRRVGGEVDAAGDVGARQVQLDARPARPSRQLRGHRDELVLGLAGDVDDDGGRQRTQVRQVMVEEVVDAVVVQADGVEHAARRLDGARRRVAGARLAR